MRFNKYKRYGAYHWKWYNRECGLAVTKQGELKDKTSLHYQNNVNRIKEWVKEKNTLDIGAGDGLMVHVLGLAKGVDDEPWAVRAAIRRGVEVDLGSAYNLPYKDNQFESALMADVLEHFEFPDKALKEARRVISKYLYLVVPIEEGKNEPYHYREYSEAQLKDIMANNGFVLEDNIDKANNKMYAKFKKNESNTI